MIDNNAKLTPKIFEDLIEDKIDSNDFQGINISAFMQNKNSENKIKQLNPNFSIFANRLQLQFLFFPYNNTKNILFVFNKEKLKKKIEIIFEKNSDFDYNFFVEKIVINQANENEIAFLSKEKIAILFDITNLINSKETKINLNFILSTNDLSNDNNNNNDTQLKILQFYFWDFEKHFGIITTDNKIRIFFYNNFNEIELIYELDSEIIKNKSGVKYLNLTDFQFSDIKTSHFLEAFSLIILDFTGRIFTVKYIFPL